MMARNIISKVKEKFDSQNQDATQQDTMITQIKIQGGSGSPNLSAAQTPLPSKQDMIKQAENFAQQQSRRELEHEAPVVEEVHDVEDPRPRSS
jgi:hypothetical protein